MKVNKTQCLLNLFNHAQWFRFCCIENLLLIHSGLLVAGIAYLVPDWHEMQLIFSLPLLLLLGTYWVLPESPR